MPWPKAVTFCWLLLIYPLPKLLPELWAQWSVWLQNIGFALVLVAVALCLLRGLPVIIEFIYAERETIIGRAASAQGRGPGASD